MKREVALRWGVKIPMRDGIHLSATLYLPLNLPSPSPVLFTSTPYVGQTYHDQAMYFASNAYPCLTVDVRGRGNSQGEFHPKNEAADVHDVVEWIARQTYCNGKVGMWGGSYSGYVQWAATKQHPAHLATMIPVASPYRGVDSPLRNNMFVPYTMQWLTVVSGCTLQDKLALEDRPFWNFQFRRWFEAGAPFRDLDSFLGNPSALFQEWIAHPQQDAYWDSYNPSMDDYASLSIPILTITGTYDSNQAGALMHYKQHMANVPPEGRAGHYLVIGPWDHAGTRSPRAEFGGLKLGLEALVDLRNLHLEWYRWVLQGGPRPQFLRNNVAYYVMGADTWRYADTLDAVTAYSQPWHLHSRGNPTDVFCAGSLVLQRTRDVEPDCYVHDPRDLDLAELEMSMDPECLTDQRMIYAASGRQLIYHSQAFEKSVEISGFFRLTMWISIDQPDTDFRAAVYEVTLDGSSVLLATDCMRARYRESLREAVLVRTQEPLRYEFQHFTFVSRQIARGSRLRLVFGPVHSIFAQRNFNSGGVVTEESMSDARVVTVKVFHDETFASTLHVPFGPEP